MLLGMWLFFVLYIFVSLRCYGLFLNLLILISLVNYDCFCCFGFKKIVNIKFNISIDVISK